jgi:general secretion pathway protein G
MNSSSWIPLRRRAFTFLEIIVVVVIIGLLVSLSAAGLVGRLESSKRKIAQATVDGMLSSALDVYYTENNFYPTTAQGLAALVTKPTSSPIPQSWNESYVKHSKALLDPWGRPYEYAYPSQREGNAEFDLWSRGKDADDPADDIGNWDEN